MNQIDLLHCHDCGKPITGSHFSIVEGESLCPFCEEKATNQWLQTYGFALKLEADFGVVEDAQQRQYG